MYSDRHVIIPDDSLYLPYQNVSFSGIWKLPVQSHPRNCVAEDVGSSGKGSCVCGLAARLKSNVERLTGKESGLVLETLLLWRLER